MFNKKFPYEAIKFVAGVNKGCYIQVIEHQDPEVYLKHSENKETIKDTLFLAVLCGIALAFVWYLGEIALWLRTLTKL